MLQIQKGAGHLSSSDPGQYMTPQWPRPVSTRKPSASASWSAASISFFGCLLRKARAVLEKVNSNSSSQRWRRVRHRDVSLHEDQSDRLLTAAETAELLRIPRSTVYELARNRRIPFLKIGRRTLFDRQSLLKWIAAQTVQPRR